MKQITQRFGLKRSPTLVIPLALVGMMILAFGLQLPWQGFTFSDDWHFIYYSLIDGPRGLQELFHYDGHPQSTWGYLLGFRLLGYAPLAWHLLSFFWKVASVLMFWGLLHLVWPGKTRQTFTVALLFAIHPYFTLQVFAITYFEVWYSFFLLWLSIFLTIKAVRQPERIWLWTGLAILAKIGHIFTSEYNWFLEILRPFFVWLVLPAVMTRSEKFRRTATTWLPYFSLFLVSVIWRGFFYEPLRKSFRVTESIFDNPLLTVLSAVRHWIPDSALTLFTSWYYTLKPEYLDFANRANIFILLAALCGGLLAYFAAKTSTTEAQLAESDKDWVPAALLTGFVGLFVGFLPSYAAGYATYLSDWPGNGRLALAAFPGAALILTALLELIARPRARLVIIAFLAALMVGWHVRVNHEFRMVWEAQREFYQQLTWRIPSLKPNTMLLLTNSYLPRLAPDSPAQMAIRSDLAVTLATNAIYAALPNETGRIPYWFSSDLSIFASRNGLAAPPSLDAAYATLSFTGQPGRLVALHFDPKRRECLRVLGPEYADYKRIPPQVKDAARLSHPENILPVSQANSQLRDAILDAGKQPSWCYFYQKGALAAQYEQWQETVELWEKAEQKRLSPRNGYELLPFIQAHIYTHKWKDAASLTRLSNHLNPGMDAALCPLWRDAQKNANSSPEQEKAVKQVNNLLECQP